jgi:hypothetical protein
MPLFPQFFSLDSPKAIKARGFGWLNAINYMAPHDTAGVGNLCPHASPACMALCLGWHSGQAGMIKRHANPKTTMNAARRSRVAKARLFMTNRSLFLRELFEGVNRAQRKAYREGLKLCVRLNGATDIGWEGVRFPNGRTIFEHYSTIQFVDYTKSVKRALRAASDPTWPPNYSLTFSRSEINDEDCRRVLAAGGNVAVVFAGDRPKAYLGHAVIDGDKHDLRHLDPKGVVIALSPKGAKAKRDKSGFVVR